MTKITADLAISLDSFVAGPNQSAANPFGEGVGERLHGWMFDHPARTPRTGHAVEATRQQPSTRLFAPMFLTGQSRQRATHLRRLRDIEWDRSPGERVVWPLGETE